MYSFKDFIVATDPRMADDEWLAYMKQKREHSEDVEFDEALDARARMKLKQAMRKNKSKIAIARKKSMSKKANKDQLEKRARKQAVKVIKKKLLKGKDESELSFSGRKELEKKVEKKKGAISKLAKRLLKKVRKDESDRMSKK
jgi:hypothetical protein